MLALFCLRLALGMMAALLVVPSDVVNPRFFRTHFLVVLGLGALAVAAMPAHAVVCFWATLAGIGLAFFGSLLWSLDGAPGGRTIIHLTVTAVLVAVVSFSLAGTGLLGQEQDFVSKETFAPAVVATVVDDMTSATVLGFAITSMLMGHSYLIAPAMSLVPLLRLLAALFVSLIVRVVVSIPALWQWTEGAGVVNLNGDQTLWMPVRWLVGLALPLVLAWMAWQTARMRSTQSATGILYVLVICCFLGELVSLIQTG
jgi:hypothetical protein